MEDLTLSNPESAEHQVEQIKYRADSIAPLIHQAKSLTNMDIVIKSWKELLEKKDTQLNENDKKITQNLLSLMENYKEMRDKDPAFALKNNRQWFVANWNKIFKETSSNSSLMKALLEKETQTNTLDLNLLKSEIFCKN